MPPDLISPGRSAIFLKVRILRDGCALTDSGQRAGGQAETRGNRLPQKKDRTVDTSLYVCAALLAAFPIRMLPRIRSPKTYQILLEKQMYPIRGFAACALYRLPNGICWFGCADALFCRCTTRICIRLRMRHGIFRPWQRYGDGCEAPAKANGSALYLKRLMRHNARQSHFGQLAALSKKTMLQGRLLDSAP